MEYKDIKTRMDLISWIAQARLDEFHTTEQLAKLVTEASERIRIQEMVSHEPQADN